MAMTAQDYKIYKSLDPSELTDEERKDLIDYERAEAKAPSIDDVQWATDIHNMASKNPSTLGRELKESGDYQKALDILNADRAYTATLGPNTQNAYVQPVKRIPDDLNSKFNFNWKSAYENTKGEKLRDTEADYDKLQKFIDSNMYKEGDNVNLQKIAYDMHMYNPNTMKWSEFINSEQGNEFKKYIADVRENQRKTSIEKIFSGEEPTKVNYPLLGPTDIPGSNALVDFGLPVSKAYAQQQLLEDKDPKMGLPMAADFAANALMFGGSKPAMVAAPTVRNAGEYAFNNVEPEVAAINTIMGVGSNIMTPYVVQRGGKYFNTPGANYTTKVKLQARVDQIANDVAKIQKKTRNGALWEFRNEAGEVNGYGNNIKKILYTDDGNAAVKAIDKGYTVKPLHEMPNHKAGVLSPKEVEYVKQNQDVLRQMNLSDSKTAAKLREQKYKAAHSKYAQKYIKQAYEKYVQNGGKFDNFELNELYSLGYNPMKESFGQFVWRTVPDAVKNFGTNFLGRSVSAGTTMKLPNLIAGQDLDKLLKSKKDKKPLISEIFGQDQN